MSDVKIFASICEDEARKQIETISALDAFSDAKIRIMPDVHAGKGCVCGFTADLGKKVVPNLVGVDIGCGVLAARIGQRDVDLKRFDEIVHATVPCGQKVNGEILPDVDGFYGDCDPGACHIAFGDKERDYFKRSMGTLGGGNHFIELDRADDGTVYLVVHCGSRNLGKKVCDAWQKVAVGHTLGDGNHALGEAIEKARNECLASGDRKGIAGKIAEAKAEWRRRSGLVNGNKDLAYLEGEDRDGYVEDMRLCQRWAAWNRKTIVRRICEAYGLEVADSFDTPHNYLGDDNIIRKSAISARKGEKVLIPMNMRDGSLVCIGKGNEDWNFSAPHGAGRLMSRSKAKKQLNLADFRRTMEGVYTTSCVQETIDEAPEAYKPWGVIADEIGETVEVVGRIVPIYNFKGYDK